MGHYSLSIYLRAFYAYPNAISEQNYIVFFYFTIYTIFYIISGVFYLKKNIYINL